jgi:hypothetical protein
VQVVTVDSLIIRSELAFLTGPLEGFESGIPPLGAFQKPSLKYNSSSLLPIVEPLVLALRRRYDIALGQSVELIATSANRAV